MFGLLEGLMGGIFGGMGDMMKGVTGMLGGGSSKIDTLGSGVVSDSLGSDQMNLTNSSLDTGQFSSLSNDSSGMLNNMSQKVDTLNTDNVFSMGGLKDSNNSLAPINVAYKQQEIDRNLQLETTGTDPDNIANYPEQSFDRSVAPADQERFMRENDPEYPVGKEEEAAMNKEYDEERAAHDEIYKNIQKFLPNGRPEFLDAIKNGGDILKKYGIDTPERQKQFFAQISHESMGLKTATELGSGQNYEGRKDLGNNKAGDGMRYKGRGFIQLTGKSNYAKYGKQLGIDLVNHPELASNPETALELSAAYWQNNKLNRMADQKNLRGITQRINGGTNGLKDRQRYYDMFQGM